VADIEEFCHTPIMGELPAGQFQSPACTYAFQRRAAGKLRILTAPNGDRMAFRDKIVLTPCAPVL
jgi:hypothetical protein